MKDKITRPVLRYQGSKFRIAQWIISHFPSHEVYCESFGGGASVLMQKKKCKTEVYNDIDSGLYNLFRVLRDKDKISELTRRIYLTPWSREDFNESYNDRLEDDDIEKARKMIVRSFFGNGTGGATRKGKNGFSSKIDSRDYKFHCHEAFIKYFSQLELFCDRLRTVIIENTDGLKVINIYDTDKTLHYIDPPYIQRCWNKFDYGVYSKKMDDEQHIELINIIQAVKGYVVLSGYDNELYDSLLHGWHKDIITTNNVLRQKRTEVIWISPRTFDALNQQKNLLK